MVGPRTKLLWNIGGATIVFVSCWQKCIKLTDQFDDVFFKRFARTDHVDRVDISVVLRYTTYNHAQQYRNGGGSSKPINLAFSPIHLTDQIDRLISVREAAITL